MQYPQMLREKFDHFQIWANNTQHVATGWPNGSNMLRPTMLDVGICCAECCERSFGRGLTLELPQGGIFMASIGRNEDMSRNLARQISRDLRSNCFAMVFIIAGFYCDSRAHNFRKVRVVKYIEVYGQIKAAAQKYCHNQRWRRKLKEVSFRTLPGYWRQFRWFFAEIS